MSLINKLFCLYSLIFSLTLFASPNKLFLKINEKDKLFYKENLHNIPIINSVKKHIFDGPEIGTLESKYQTAEMETRGQGCLRAFRKCFGVDLKNSINLNGQNFEKFDLLSMREDVGYTNVHLGMNVFNLLGLFPLKKDYVELFINNANWGLYTIVEAPNFYFKKNLKTPFAGRAQGIFYKFQSRFYNEKIAKNSEKDFLSSLRNLVKIAKKNHSHGDTLYRLLKEKMDIDQYLALLAVNSLLRNKDYSDEIYFYVDPTKYAEGKIYFKVMIWDPEVLFSNPHPTPYNLIWKNRIAKTLFYSMENKLDRKLAKDKYINKKMATILKEILLNTLTDKKLLEVVEKVRGEISPYLTESALKASIYDFKHNKRENPYSPSEILNLLKNKENMLILRRNELLHKSNLILSAD